ncbi:MAG: hypothetical protein CMH52_06390 [Myxococcales bacterium]|nr:hypothetical protein [Myxococcales bacterium]
MTDENFEKDIAEMVIRPKLQRVVNKYTCNNKADLRKYFIQEEGVSMSAAKFEGYLTMLGITFEKRVEIKGLFTDAPPPPVAGADASEEDDLKFDNEMPPIQGQDPRSGRNRSDMFGLI